MKKKREKQHKTVGGAGRRKKDKKEDVEGEKIDGRINTKTA